MDDLLEMYCCSLLMCDTKFTKNDENTVTEMSCSVEYWHLPTKLSFSLHLLTISICATCALDQKTLNEMTTLVNRVYILTPFFF